jgi:hypothetical protein
VIPGGPGEFVQWSESVWFPKKGHIALIVWARVGLVRSGACQRLGGAKTQVHLGAR